MRVGTGLVALSNCFYYPCPDLIIAYRFPAKCHVTTIRSCDHLQELSAMCTDSSNVTIKLNTSYHYAPKKKGAPTNELNRKDSATIVHCQRQRSRLCYFIPQIKHIQPKTYQSSHKLTTFGLLQTMVMSWYTSGSFCRYSDIYMRCRAAPDLNES